MDLEESAVETRRGDAPIVLHSNLPRRAQMRQILNTRAQMRETTRMSRNRYAELARGFLRRRVERLWFPRVVRLTDFDDDAILFEISNLTERNRVVNHGYETEYTTRMLAELRADDLLWDIGSCVGLVSLHAARICEVVAFEPDPEFRERLIRNLELNPDLAVEIIPAAISDKDGLATLFTDGAAGYSPSLRLQRNKSRTVIEVQARTIDSLVGDGLRPPTVLKVDVEGAEMLALRGAQDLLATIHKPRLIFLAIHGDFLPAFGSSAEEVIEFVTTAGYVSTYQADRAQQSHRILRAV